MSAATPGDNDEKRMSPEWVCQACFGLRSGRPGDAWCPSAPMVGCRPDPRTYRNPK